MRAIIEHRNHRHEEQEHAQEVIRPMKREGAFNEK